MCRYGAEKGGYLVIARGDVGMGFIPHPRVAIVVNPSGRPCSGWRVHRKSIIPPWLSINCVCFFQAKPGEGPVRSISIMACCFIQGWVSEFAEIAVHTLSKCVKEKGRIPSAWKGLRVPLFLPLSSLSLSDQASTFMAAEL